MGRRAGEEGGTREKAFGGNRIRVLFQEQREGGGGRGRREGDGGQKWGGWELQEGGVREGCGLHANYGGGDFTLLRRFEHTRTGCAKEANLPETDGLKETEYPIKEGCKQE